ncbi:Aldehyde dehydrogenase family 16 member A1 [Lonchura striata]|uniref:Aldehyde dehydrogenase family 16 member A1 n=1 Tax=Lonchura striata TaxID=40157 RepID=A0A218U8F0_9PASE|nr:Aldehyde dehydrogenase family 16 member A1 [Lonchura striata domestica]
MAALAALGAPPVPEIFATMEEGPVPGEINAGEAWLESHGRSLGHFVGGTWLKPPGRVSLACPESSTGRTLATVPAGDSSDVAVAVAAAAAAAEAWAGLGGPQRGQHLTRLAAALAGERRGAVGALLALAGGRPLHRTLGADLDLALRLLRAPAAAAELGPPGLEGWAPLGVVALVLGGPCSLPALLWKLGPLLAMGNTALVLCPAATAPPLLLLGELSREGAALPPGVLNVLAGPLELCQALRAHPEIASVTFLGVPQFPAGGCVVLAQDAVAAALEQRLRARLGGLQLGDPTDPKTEVGPLPPGTCPPEGVVQEALQEGAQVFQVPLPPLPEQEHRFYPLTLISGVAPTSRCLREPAPGPLLVLLPVRSPTEAVALASALPQTAAAAVWAQDITMALDTADRLPQGLVWLNALDLLDPNGGCAGGAADTDPDEALREFGCPPWEQAPKVDELLSPLVAVDDPGDPELAHAVAAARGAAPGWGRLPGASRARTPWLLLDYPVAMPSNLEPDGACSDLWGLHFGALALQRMLGVAGKDLAPLLRTLLAQLHFVAECHIQDPQRCVQLEMVNVSQLLETLMQHLGGLQGRPPHFPGCARLRCHPGPALTSPAVRHEGTLGARQGAASPAGHGLVLLGGVGGVLVLVAVVWAGLSHW